jgi:hypothetical protein
MLRMPGAHHGYFVRAPASLENETLLGKIDAADPHTLFVPRFRLQLRDRSCGPSPTFNLPSLPWPARFV